jgi:hypothetical protein
MFERSTKTTEWGPAQCSEHAHSVQRYRPHYDGEYRQGEVPTGTHMVKPAAPRVVFLHGALGSVLTDGSLTPDQARRECESNLGALGRVFRGSRLYPCDKHPETLWGGVGSLHWLLSPQEWGRRIRSGNGLDAPGSVRTDGLLDIDVRFGRRRLAFQPYASLLRALRAAGADLLVVPYDWRLSIVHNALVLQQRIAQKWYGGPNQRWVGTVPEHERITFIGHSLGGLLARYFVESPRRNGWRVMGRVITVGTPHLGAPQAFLHFTGKTFPFPDNPFYRSAHEVLLQQALASHVPVGAEFRTQFLPGRVQTQVFQFMASAIELMPVYNFVQSGGRPEPFPTTYRPLSHGGTGRPAMQLLQVFRNGMRPENQLEAWLNGLQREYHFLAADGFPTVMGYERTGDRIITERRGDGTVPVGSARVFATSSAHVHVKTFMRGGLDHARLCERTDVQTYILGVLRSGQPRPAGGSPIRVTSRRAPQVEEYVAMARAIMARAKIPARRGVVLSITRLETPAGPPLVDTTTEPSTSPTRCRLKNPPAHLSSRDVFEVDSPRSGRFRYVLIHSNEGEGGYPIGGYLFLPEPGERHIYLATFNVGPMDTRYRAQCKNGHHAEIQLTRFVEHQPVAWRRRLSVIRIDNRSRSDRLRGYSPCNACCHDLAGFLTALKALQAQPRIDATLSWLVRYTGAAICGHPTDQRGIGMLKTSGWRLPDPMPTTVQEVAAWPRELVGAHGP